MYTFIAFLPNNRQSLFKQDCVRCDFWRLAAQSNHCQFSLQYSRVLLLSVNYFHAKVWPSNTSCFPIKVTFIFNRESTYYILVLVNRWCVCTNSCRTLISGIKYVMEDSPAEYNSKNIYGSEQELTLKPCESACMQAPEIPPSECRLPNLSCWWLHWLESRHSDVKAASCARAAVPPRLPSNQGLKQLCKEVAQPHPVTVCLHSIVTPLVTQGRAACSFEPLHLPKETIPVSFLCAWCPSILRCSSTKACMEILTSLPSQPASLLA